MDIREKGIDELSAKLNRMGAGFDGFMAQTMNKAVLYVHSQVPAYPPPPSTSTYRRTGTLGRSITTVVRGLGAETVGIIGTNIEYAPWVISEEQYGSRGPQTRVHFRTGWWTLHKVVRDATPEVKAFFDRELARYLK